MIGSELFLLPDISILPLSRFPPLITKLSMIPSLGSNPLRPRHKPARFRPKCCSAITIALRNFSVVSASPLTDVQSILNRPLRSVYRSGLPKKDVTVRPERAILTRARSIASQHPPNLKVYLPIRAASRKLCGNL
jgi:hypothetical protein